jgi:hypothetical protein
MASPNFTFGLNNYLADHRGNNGLAPVLVLKLING